MPTATLPHGHWRVPEHWQLLDLLSDLHLQASEPGTFEAWRAHMLGTPADAVLLLGDVFEVWVGDDALDHDPFLQACAEVLRHTSAQRTVAFMPGNRDFLVGERFLQACGVQRLQDPTLLRWGAQDIVLSHGDALCLDDEAYQRFRAVARTPSWQAEFLARPLAERLALAQSMRAQSEAHNQSMQHFADADAAMTRQWLSELGSTHLIHGHTHRPADHAVPELPGALRQVLSDWHVHDEPVEGAQRHTQPHSQRRAQVLRLHADGRRERLNV